MSITQFITEEELSWLAGLLETPDKQSWIPLEKLKKFQHFIKIRILKTLNQVSEEEYEIWPNIFKVVLEKWVVGLQNMSTWRFRPIDNLDIEVNWTKLLDFFWEKLVSVEIEWIDTYFVLNTNTFITPLEGLID